MNFVQVISAGMKNQSILIVFGASSAAGQALGLNSVVQIPVIRTV